MAYSSYGKKIYASIKDLPQYTSIGNGDKIIVWNETRDGAAVVDYTDFVIDLDHTTFKSTIDQVITLASDIQEFAHTVNEEIDGLQNTVSDLQETIDKEIKARIKVLEFIVAVILGSNSYWLSAAGLDILRTRFLVEGISEGASIDDSVDSEEGQAALKWYNGFINTVQNYVMRLIPNISTDDLLLQNKFRYKYTDVSYGVSTNTNTASATSTTTITNKDASGKTTSSTEITYS